MGPVETNRCEGREDSGCRHVSFERQRKFWAAEFPPPAPQYLHVKKLRHRAVFSQPLKFL